MFFRAVGAESMEASSHFLMNFIHSLTFNFLLQMFSFGSTALDQFKDRLVEWPQYCNHILQISHIRESQSELVDFIERALMRGGRAQHEIAGSGSFPTDQHFGNSVQSGSPSLMPMEILDSSDGDDKKSVNLQPQISGSEVSHKLFLSSVYVSLKLLMLNVASNSGLCNLSWDLPNISLGAFRGGGVFLFPFVSSSPISTFTSHSYFHSY